MPYVFVDSFDDSRLDIYARLTEAQLRNKLEPEKGIFIAESIKVIERALDAGMVPLSVLLTPRWVDAAPEIVTRIEQAAAQAQQRKEEQCSSRQSSKASEDASGEGAAEEEAFKASTTEQNVSKHSADVQESAIKDSDGAGIPLYVLPDDELKKLTGFALTRGILCAMRRPKLPIAEDLIANIVQKKAIEQGCDSADVCLRIAVLEGIVDHTNVGAIFRSAAALGADAILVTPTCCDPLYRRATRVSMGTVFQVPWTRIGENAHDWPEPGIDCLHAMGFKTAAMALSDDSIPLGSSELAACKRLALVFGTEGDGLAQRTIADCDFTVRIPMKHDVDSLNVAAASAVAFWELCASTSESAKRGTFSQA